MQKAPLSTYRTAGNLVFFSGSTPKDPATGGPHQGDIQEQTTALFAQLEEALHSAGCTKVDIIRVGVYLAHLDRDFAAFNETYRGILSDPYPARTTTGAALRGVLVEIDMVAARRQDPS